MPTTSAQAKASAEIIGEGLILGRTGEVLQPMVDATGALGSGFVPTPSNARMALQGLLPLKATLVQVYNTHLAQNASSKPDIRAARELVLPEAGMYTPVSLAVRDSGVDTARFGRQVLRGADGQPALMAFDKYGRPGTGELAVIPGDLRARLPQLIARTKGVPELQSNIDNPEASQVKQQLSTLPSEPFTTMIEEINLTGNDAHGTRGGHRDGQLRPCRQASCQRLPGAEPAAGRRAGGLVGHLDGRTAGGQSGGQAAGGEPDADARGADRLDHPQRRTQ